MNSTAMYHSQLSQVREHYFFVSFQHVGHRVGEVAHDYVPALKQWLSAKGIRNSYESWHGML